MLSGVFVVWLSFAFEQKRQFILVLVLGGLTELLIEFLRLHWPPAKRLVNRVFSSLMRSGEESRMSGIPFYSVGVTVAFTIFPKPIAILAVLYLAFGDPVASIAGKYFRAQGSCKELLTNRTWAGSLSAATVCTLITYMMSYFLFSDSVISGFERVGFAFVGGVCAGLGEVLPLRTDDNLSMPIVAGSLLWLYASLTGLVPGLVV